MHSTTIKLESGATSVRLKAIRDLAERPRTILQAATSAVRKRAQDHFVDRNKRGNSKGGRRTNFWLDVMKSTQIGEVTDRYGIVAIGDRRFALKVFGGVVKPVEAEFLTIPMSPDAHGRRARDESGGSPFERFTGRELFPIRQRRLGLLASKMPGSDDKIQVEYLLVPSARHEPDPEALPPQGELEEIAVGAAQEQLQTEIMEKNV